MFAFESGETFPKQSVATSAANGDEATDGDNWEGWRNGAFNGCDGFADVAVLSGDEGQEFARPNEKRRFFAMRARFLADLLSSRRQNYALGTALVSHWAK
ncbi:MAG: hypothetical protein J6K20_00760 [Thermoguttaceae bacterium]|nr:hypothetical protein [Thermoguttaceae bacterium]